MRMRLSILLWVIVTFSIAALNPIPVAEAQTASPNSINGIPQPQTVIFDHLTMEDGLSEATVLAMTQDELGFMWFATQNGLDKYDGYNFIAYKHDPDDLASLSSNNTRALYLANDGALWVGTFDGGVNRMDRTMETFTRYQHDSADPTSLSDDYARAIQEDQEGRIWVGTQNGLNRLDAATGTFARYLHDEDDPNSLGSNTVYAMALDTAGSLWVGTSSGLCRYDDAGDQFSCFQHREDDSRSLTDNVISTITADPSGMLWVGTMNGLNAFDPTTGTSIQYLNDAANSNSLSNDQIYSLDYGTDGLWVGTVAGGLNYFDPMTGLFAAYMNDPDHPNSLSTNGVRSLHMDRSGILWIGALLGEINILDPVRYKFSTLISLTSPLSIEGDAEGNLWVASFDNGLYEIDASGQVITSYHHDPDDSGSLVSDRIYFVMLDAGGTLWIGTINGLDRLDLTTREFTHVNSGAAAELGNATIRALFQDSAGMVWVGSSVGTFCLDLSEDTTGCALSPETRGLFEAIENVGTIYEDADGLLWFGGFDGLYGFNPSDESIRHYTHEPNNPNSLSENQVTVITPGEGEHLWIGTWSGGLNEFDPTNETFIRYTVKDGLSDDLVLGILKDNQSRLWISTANGLCLFDPQTGTFHTYDRFDGLPYNSFNHRAYFQSPDGEMYFGASNAVVAFRPEAIHHNPYVPPVVLTGFQLFNRDVAIGVDSPLQQHPNYVTDLTLNYNQSIFSFEYVALNFTAAPKNQYAYMMEGVDPDWNYVGDRRLATYTNLAPGQYTFRVTASNNDGVWNQEGLTIRLMITPPWWQTWWAYGLYGLAGVGLVTGYIGYRTRAQARELAAQRREVAHERQIRETLERVDRSKDDERARIAREMHDGLAQTLAGVRFRLRTWQFLLDSEPTQLTTEFSEVGTVLDESVEDLRRVIFALRPVSLDEQGLVLAITGLAEDINKHYPVQVQLNIDEGTRRLTPALEHALFRITQELLNNAARHADAKTIWVNLTIQSERIHLEVRDDGVGFTPPSPTTPVRSGHFGLIHLHERVALLKGTITINSAPSQGVLSQGTEIQVILPLGSAEKTDDDSKTAAG